MTHRFTTAFFAYPSQPASIGGTVTASCDHVNKKQKRVLVRPWPQLDVFGASIPDEIRDAIDAADVVYGDITFQNRNVYYEIGYGIGKGKAIAPIINVAFEGVEKDVQRDGLFDAIGYAKYENADQLSARLLDVPTTRLRELYSRDINYQQPIFLLDTFRKTDFRNTIVSAIKDSKVHYRSFDPVEVPRLTTVSIIGEITASAGVIIPILGPNIDDSGRHNLRAALLAGLCHGLERETLLLELLQEEIAHPLDYRAKITGVRNPGEIAELVSEFAASAHIASQSIKSRPRKISRSALQGLALGSSAAENEFRTLGQYFVETAEYLRTLRGEVSVVAGRKGSGKSAIFFQVRDHLREKNAK